MAADKGTIFYRYVEVLEFSGINIPAELMVVLTLVFAGALALVGFLFDVTLAILLPLISLDIVFGLQF